MPTTTIEPVPIIREIDYIDRKPPSCRFDDEKWARYLIACQQGNLFFTAGAGLFAKINFWYQSRVLKRSYKSVQVCHVGIVGDARGAYESHMWTGPSRNAGIDPYTIGNGRLIIGRLKYAPGQPVIDRAFRALIWHIQKLQRTRFWKRYDLISLITGGALQRRDSDICSELVKVYVDEICRHDERYELRQDAFVLPAEWLDECFIIFDG